MALLGQQALHIAALFSSRFSSAVFNSGSSDVTSCWASRSSASPGMTTKFASSCCQPFRKLPRISSKVFGSVNCLPQWHSIGTLGVYGRSSQRRRAERGDGDGNGSEDETEVIKDGELEKDEETRDELSREVEEAQGNADNEKQRAERQESQGGNGEGKREEADRKETVLQNEDFMTAFGRRIWGFRRNVEDDSLDPKEELLLRDLESLNFNWRALLDPTWENVLALGFTALLSVAVLKISFQLVLVVFTILFAALKYTVLAALLLGLLIFLI